MALIDEVELREESDLFPLATRLFSWSHLLASLSCCCCRCRRQPDGELQLALEWADEAEAEPAWLVKVWLVDEEETAELSVP